MLAETESVVGLAVSFLKDKGVDVEGVALVGSRAKGLQHKDSDYDLLILSNAPQNLHIEDVFIADEKVQLFILPMKTLDLFLVLNTIAGNGMVASTFDKLVIFEGADVFKRVISCLRSNLAMNEKIESESVNRNLGRLRNRVSKLLKDLSHSTNQDENVHTGAELLKTAGQFLLAKRSRFFLPTEKHLHRELTKFYSEQVAKELVGAYRAAVANSDYSGLIRHCTQFVLDGNVLQGSSSSDSNSQLKRNIGYNVIFINSYSTRLIRLIYDLLKDHHPQLVLNQNRDLLHLGVFGIANVGDFQSFVSKFDDLPLSRSEFNCVTLNYQLDYFLLQHFKKYDHDGLLVALSQYAMAHDLDRDILMNSIVDWTINSAIDLFDRSDFTEYVRTCTKMYRNSMPNDPDRFSLDQITGRNRRLRESLSRLDFASVKVRYQDAIRKWECDDQADGRIRRRITAAYRHNLASSGSHSMFKEKIAFSNYFYLLEAVFEAMLIGHTEKGLIYVSLASCLEFDLAS